MTKRIFDVFFAMLSLLIFSGLMVFTWFAAALDTQTNGVFIQERIGQFGKKIKVYKLRTMQVTAVSQGDQISKIGKFFRQYKLDELPQLFNVLKGEMSIVGPRPDVAGYYDELKGENRKILELKPGLTSLASLKYFNEEYLLQCQENPLEFNDTILFQDKVQMNLRYYKEQSFWGDIRIIAKTITKIMFSNKTDLPTKNT